MHICRLVPGGTPANLNETSMRVQAHSLRLYHAIAVVVWLFQRSGTRIRHDLAVACRRTLNDQRAIP